MSNIIDYIDQNLSGKRPTQVILCTVGTLVTLKLASDALSDGQLPQRTYKAIWRVLRNIADPFIQKEINKISSTLKMPSTEGDFRSLTLPEKGRPCNEIIKIVSKLHEDLDKDYSEGQFSGAVYHGGEEHTKFVNEVMAMFQWSNPLHSDIFGATRKMEAEIVSMVVSMFNGHLLPDACGVVTSGGTESILMAMKTYRDWGRNTKGLTTVSVIAPITAHSAFDKAAEYFGIRLIKVPVCQTTQRVSVAEVEKYIRYDTVALVGSAPTFPHGVVDPIEELAELAYRHNIGMHVDCCLGGFIMPFIAKTGRKSSVVDFRNRGVTSISCDTHKYGYAPKGTSTVLFRTKKLRSFQFVCVAEWPGGLYCSPAVSGSKPGNVIAATWASMVHFGLEGYVDCCDKIMSTREKISGGISKIPYLHIIGDPTASVFAFGSNQIDIFELGDALTKRGWCLNVLQYPCGLQFSITLLQTKDGIADKFLKDVKEIGGELIDRQLRLRSEGKFIKINEKSAHMYGTSQRVPDRTIIQDVLREFMAAYYTTY